MITQFTLLLAHGMSLMWLLMPRRLVTSGFFRIQSLVALGLCVLATLAAGQLTPAISPGQRTLPATAQPSSEAVESTHSLRPDSPPTNLTGIRVAAILAAIFAYFGSALWRIEYRSAGTVCLYGIFVATLAGLICLAPRLPAQSSAEWFGQVLSLWSSAAVIGGATTAMLLGHWYLTAPMMSLAPLRRLTHLWFAALMLRLVLSAWAWMHAGEAVAGSLIWTWMALRWLAGILAPLLLAVMTDRILRYRNTQAATGVLFAGVILVFLGEMSAALLQAELRQPL